MWEWYREWSQIARSLIKDGRLLIVLGLAATGRPKKGDDEDAEDASTGTPANGDPVVVPDVVA